MNDILQRMANTAVGRNLLCIDQSLPTIIKVSSNHVIATDGTNLIADFRTHNKWAKVLKTRRKEICSFARYFINPDYNVPLSPAVKEARAVVAASLTAYPDPNPESATVDGGAYITNATFATAHDAAAGDAGADADATWQDNYDFSAGNYIISREFFLFDTSALTASASISAAVLSIFGRTGVSNADSSSASIVSSSPTSNTAIAAGDFDQLGSTAFASIAYGSWNTAAYNDFSLNANGIANVSLTGISKFGRRNSLDISNTAPSGLNRLNYFFADQAGTTNDPKLVVTYTLSSGTKLLPLLGVGS